MVLDILLELRLCNSPFPHALIYECISSFPAPLDQFTKLSCDMLAGASDVKQKVDIRFGSLLKMKSLKQRAIKVNHVRRCAPFIFAMDYVA